MLPVGGYATTTALKAGLDIQLPYTFMIPSAAVTTSIAWATGSVNTATTGMSIPFAGTIRRLTWCANCSALSGTPTVTITAWKTNQTAGSEIMAAASAVALNTGVGPVTSTTVLNSGKQTFAANDVFLISYVSTATSCTLQLTNITLWITPL